MFVRGCALLLAALCLIASAETDFKIGPDVSLDSLAMSAGDQQYLVAWRDVTTGGTQSIRGATVTSKGVVSLDFPISGAGAVPIKNRAQRGTVAYDPVTKNYLVVWADLRAASPGIRGTLVTPEGRIAAADILIGTVARGSNHEPLVAFNGIDFVVAWQDSAASDGLQSRIYFSRLSVNGVAGAVSALPLTAGQRLEFLVGTPGGESMLVWQDVGVKPNASYATRIAGNDAFIEPAEGTLLFHRDFSVKGFGAPIAAAFDGTEYTILSSHGAQIDSSVFKSRLRLDGTLVRPSTPFAEVGQGMTGLEEDSFPRAFFNPSAQLYDRETNTYSAAKEYFFIRNIKVSDTAFHLVFKRVTNEAIDRDPNTPLFDDAAQGVLNGAVVSSIGSQYLVVWLDGRRSGVQPGQNLNVFGRFFDGGQQGDEIRPYIKTVARAGPIVGGSPLLVNVGNSGSTGIIDQQLWEFGDGATAIIGNTSHTYTASGEYIAVLSLIRGGLYTRDFVRIVVDGDQVGGGGGPPEVVGGTLGPVSANVTTEIVATGFAAAFNFAPGGVDSFRLLGFIDPSVIPLALTGTQGRLEIGDKSYPFTLQANGAYGSEAGVNPFVTVGLNRFSGLFAIQVFNDKLQATFEPLGVKNENVAAPGISITVPFRLNFGGIILNSTLTGAYTAKAEKTGKLIYQFANTGFPGTGYFRIFGGAAKQSGKDKEKDKIAPKTHTFQVTGNMGFGGKEGFTPAATGDWQITFGNYSEAIPVSSLKLNGELYSFNAGKNKVGIQQFVYNRLSGSFVVMWRNLPADGANPSGMPLSSTSFARADMALSMDLDLVGETYQAGGYVRFVRDKSTATKWKLR